MISTVLPSHKYLTEERKLNDNTISAFDLGYCALDGQIYVGANIAGTYPVLDNRFKNSTLFPIADIYGEVVGVSCRPLVSRPNQPKYINTVYDKSKHLYGLNVTYKDLVREQKVYVVEGNVDVLQVYQSGIFNVVGMLGSTFSFTQLCLLSRFVKTVCFVPDGDKAGTGLLTRLKESMDKKFYDADVKFIFKQLPSGFDPDNYLKKFTKQDFLNLPEEEFVK